MHPLLIDVERCDACPHTHLSPNPCIPPSHAVMGVAPSFNSNVPVTGVGPAGSVTLVYAPSSSQDVTPLVQYDDTR